MGILSTLLGNDAADAANRAAQDTYAKQQAATGAYRQYGSTLPGQYNDVAKGYDPYVNAGNSALERLMAGLGLGGNQGEFTRAYQNTPGYLEGLNTGTTSAQRALNAGHIGQSGAALKNLYRFGSDYENQRAGDYMGRLGGLAGSGLQATGAQTGIQTQGLGARNAVEGGAFQGDLGSAGTIGQGMVAGAQAQQQGIGNLMNLGGSLLGSALGGPMGGGLSNMMFGTQYGTPSWNNRQSGYGSGPDWSR